MVGMERVKKLVLAKYTEIIEGLGGAIASSTRKRAEGAIKGFDSMLSTLKKPPASIEAIAQTREYIAEIPTLLIDLKAEVRCLYGNFVAFVQCVLNGIWNFNRMTDKLSNCAGRCCDQGL